MIEDYKNFKFDLFAINPYFLLKHKDVFYSYSKNFWALQESEETFMEYKILVRKDSKINTIKELKNKSVLSRSDDYIARMILDKEVLKNTHLGSKKYIDTSNKTDNYSTSILKTYFSKEDACIVPSYSFEIANEMNPDIGRKLKVLFTSEKIFFPMLGGFQKKTPDIKVTRFRESVERLSKSASGQNVLNILKMKKISPLTEKELEPLLKYYSEYVVLKETYKDKRE